MALLLLLCAAVAVPGLLGEELSVTKGASAKIAVPDGIRKLIIGSESIIAAGPQQDGLAALLVGLSDGCSELRIQRLKGPDLVYKVAVHSDPPGPLEQVKDLLSDVRGLEIKTVGGKIIFEGNIESPTGLDKIKKVEAAYPGIIDLSTACQPDVTQAVKTLILKDLHDMGLDMVTVELSGDTVILDGAVYSPADLTNAIATAKMRVANVKSLIRLEEVMIETDIQFVEVDQNTLSSFGQNLFDNNIVLNPTASLANTGRPSLNLNASATYAINAALTAANCKSIYQEHISGASGQEVDFKQGRTIYAGGLPAVPYGVIIKVKPAVQGKDGVLADLSVEVSTAVERPGNITTTEFKTSASVLSRIGQTVVLSGFANALRSANDDKTPVAGDIPLLKLLFSGKSRSKSHKEAVLLLTMRPYFAQPATGPAFSAQSKTVLSDAAAKDPR